MTARAPAKSPFACAFNRTLECSGAYWDALGWVHFRLGHDDTAEKYLKAGWIVSQDPDEADHLGQVYERQHKQQEAARMYRLALASPSHSENDSAIQDRLDRLTGDERTRAAMKDRGDLGETRTFTVERITKETSNADFFLLIGSGSKVEDVKFVSGSEELKSADKALRAIEFKVPFPDDGPSRLVRRGILSCYPVTGCTFVLYNVGDVHSVN